MVVSRPCSTLLALVGAAALTACGGSSSGGGGGQVAPPVGGGPTTLENLSLTAGVVSLAPTASDSLSGSVDLARLGVSPSEVAATFELTTPVGQAFSFNVLGLERGAQGDVRLGLAHARDAGTTPGSDLASLDGAGLVTDSNRAGRDGAWLDVAGDGFARITVSGQIDREQVLALRADNSTGREVVLVRVAPGARSPINVDEPTPGDAPFLLSRDPIYSSDARQFGLPTVAISGDRTSVVVYEGDRADPHSPSRYELRLQHDRTTGLVTGGAEQEPSPDNTNWRDHELAALFNVLAVVSSGDNSVDLRLSFDRGASFAQTQSYPVSGVGRLPQLAIAADYSLAVTWWSGQQLMLVEGQPSQLDGSNSPTAFSFQAPVVLYTAPQAGWPLITGVEWSQGGDLAIGYAYGYVAPPAPGQIALGFTSITEFRCAVRQFGSDAFNDVLVDEEEVVSNDPSVALIGQGPSLQVFYAYEASDGIRLRVSQNAGATWSAPLRVGDATANLPKVIARDQAGQTRVDVFYLERDGYGAALEVRHWDDYSAGSNGTTYSLFQPSVTSTASGLEVHSVAWFGYDAALDGDDVVLVLDTTRQASNWAVPLDQGLPLGGMQPTSGAFNPATPPPLAPGLTEPQPAPNSAHLHQLELLRLN